MVRAIEAAAAAAAGVAGVAGVACVAAACVVVAGGAAAAAAGDGDGDGDGDEAGVAGSRRTTAGVPELAVDPAADRTADAAVAAEGAGSNERRAVAAATVNAGPVARRSADSDGVDPAGADAVPIVSVADISGSTAVMPRAAVSPGAECAVVEAGAEPAATSGPATDGAVTVSAALVGAAEADADGTGAGGVAACGVAIERRTTGLAAAAGLAAGAAGAADPAAAAAARGGVFVAALDETGAAAAAAAARDRGVAACRSAAQRPVGGLADDARIAATPAGAIADEADGAAAADAGPVADMRRTTFAEKSAALVPLGAAGAGRGPASPARLPGARSPGPRLAGARFAGAAAVDRSRSTSIGPTDVTSGGRRTRTTSPPRRPTMCPGRAASAAPVRTTRGNPRGGTTGGAAAAESATADVSCWLPCADHQYCHHRGGCTPWPTWRVRMGSGPRSDRRTSGECAVAAANRVAAIATLPIGDGRERVSGGPGRRKWLATVRPRVASAPPSLICSRIRDG